MSTAEKAKELITSYCGLECEGCEFVKSHNCGGCISTGGLPFHCENGEPCVVAKCALEKGAAFCGECESFPCTMLIQFSNDPEYGDKGERIERCRMLMAARKKEE